MNQNAISPDDPRLTLYALQGMDAAEREEFEKLLEQDPAARQAVEEIRAMAVTVTTALESESLDAAPVNGYAHRPTGKVLRFPQIYYMISGLAAACFAVFFVYWQQHKPVYVKKHYVEVVLPEMAAAEATKKDSDDQEVVAQAVRDVGMDHDTPAVAAPILTLAANPPLIMLAPGQPTTPLPAAPGEFKALDEFSVGAQQQKDNPYGNVSMSTTNGTQLGKQRRFAGSAAGGSVDRLQVAASSKLAGPGATTVYNYAGVVSGTESHAFRSPERQRFVRERENFNTEAYQFQKDNSYLRVADHPLSTFSVDVDTASYANVRRFLTQGKRPPIDAVRIEELVNYFPYRYAPPTGDVPFAAHLEVASAPWAPEHRLVRIGLKGREVSDAQRPSANLVFLLDVSGSMNEPNKLPLVKQSLRLLVNKLRADDRVAITVYAGASGLALPSTSANRKADILEAIDHLEAGGSTNGAMGIHLAYDIAKANFIAGGVNRVILATDGDFNVGTTSHGELMRLIEEKAKSGVFLSVLGFGAGNLKDGTLEQLADKGNGNYAYIDTLAEARKALVEQAGGTLVTIAKDVKIQVEFNPAQVQAYRLIGYENRLLAKEDFNNDKIDAGEIGAGHTVTALYEVVPVGAESPVAASGVDALKYQAVSAQQSAASRNETESRKLKADSSTELLTVKIRYKEPAGDASSKLEFPLRDAGARFEDASADFKFAASVAAFGMILRDSPHRGGVTLADISGWSAAGIGEDIGGYRTEFVGLVERASVLVQ